MNKRQKEIYEYVKSLLKEQKYSLTVREIVVGIGLKFTSTIHSHLDKMREMGYTDFIDASPGMLQIVR
jgi:repressor LexA